MSVSSPAAPAPDPSLDDGIVAGRPPSNRTSSDSSSAAARAASSPSAPRVTEPAKSRADRLISFAARASKIGLTLNVVGLLAVAIGFRIYQLDRLPGLNGDEAWYGVAAWNLLHGRPVSWQTPTNNLLNPLFFLPQVLAHAVAAPSPATLRWPAVISGLAALAFNFFCCRRRFGARTAWISTLALGLLPVNIIYARIAWDPAQTLLVSLAVLYAAIGAWDSPRPKRWFYATCFAYASALLVHPANIFLFFFLLIPAWRCWGDELKAWLAARRRSFRSSNFGGGAAARGARLRAAAGLFILIAGTAAVVVVVVWKGGHWIERIGDRLTQPGDVVEFARLYVRFFSGATAFHFAAGTCGISGPLQAATASFDLTGFALGAIGGAAVLWRLRQSSAAVERAVALAYGGGLVAFFLVGGPPAIAPQFARYALFLVGPAVLLVSRAFAVMIERSPAAPSVAPSAAASGPNESLRGAACLWILTGVGWLAAAACQREFFQHLEHTGGTGHATFRTAQVEPKVLAWQAIDKASPPAAAIRLISGEWWLAQPLRYLALPRERGRTSWWRTETALHAELSEGRDANLSGEHRPHLVADEILWFAEFAGTPQADCVDELVRATAGSPSWRWSEQQVADAAGRPLIRLWRLERGLVAGKIP